ncbi:MAG: S46 family peptidase [Acidobacteriia bacterium]|nr:S46 family peptidase [Terriglobia bacterium]
MRHSRWYRRLLVYGLLLCAAAILLAAMPGWADEGMWTFDNPPLKQLKDRYGFTPSQEWLDHVRLASVRFNDGGSGSFVSPHGLALTNHHVALGQLQKVSSPQKDYVKDGFYARSAAEELKCPDLELNQLVSMEDVTQRVLSAVKPGMSDEAALKARKAEVAKIEKESMDKTGFRSDVIPLYQGSEYWLYRYKKYTDLRLVFAPEQQIAFFGGDPDNFTYPRYDIDFALFRVYENDKPVDSQNYLKWNAQGAKDGDLVFVSGNPGSTFRLDTLARIETLRDNILPLILTTLNRRRDVAKQYAAQGAEQTREATQLIFGLENSIKAFVGQSQGLQDKNLIVKKQKDEADFRALVASKPEWQQAYGGAWDSIAQAETKYRGMIKPLRFRTMMWARLSSGAVALVRYVAEVKKPDGVRLDGYHDSQLESLRFRLFSPAPVYPRFDESQLAANLAFSREMLGADDPYVKAVLGDRTPEEVAKEAIAGTRLADPAFRKSLVEGGEAAVAASTDPLIVLARKADPFGREMIKSFENNVESVETPAGEKIGKARFAAYGKAMYPDATFTLRLSFGAVKGYPMNGTIAPSHTTLFGLYDRTYSFDLKPPFNLPERYAEGKSRLELTTPVDFVSTCDTIGGNSGSPVIDRQGDFVGLIFDGNIESLVGDYVYNEEKNRAVAVHGAVIIEVLRKLYDAGALADELEGK